jgi:hypothetical protein
MDLFTPIVPEDRWHAHFRSILAPPYEPCRAIVQEWAEVFPDRDGKFVQEFQITFNSPFWELYLHAVFRAYGFQPDWRHAAPDFSMSKDGAQVCVEAVTANSADGKPAEWDAPKFGSTPDPDIDIGRINREAMIRLANAIHSKHKKYLASYAKREHVRGRPFVLAAAPFEQPFFNHQYNRPIKAVLYDHYVDEPEYMANPDQYPNGPRTRQLGFVAKDNGAEIELGLFNDDRMREISAVLFSCTATWGKVDALAPDTPARKTLLRTMWGSPPDGRPIMRIGSPAEIGESLWDGLQVYHNPHALHPLAPNLLRHAGVVQAYVDPTTGRWIEEELASSLFYRLAMVATGDAGSLERAQAP